MAYENGDGRQRRSSLAVEPWTVRRLVDAINGKRHEERIFIPSFQRGFVWNQDRQDDLIRSIREARPIGSLLFFDDGIRDGKHQYQIVDGLQRSTSLINYEVDVFASYRSVDLDPKMLDAILAELEPVTPGAPAAEGGRLRERAVANAITSWIRARRSFSSKDGFSASKLYEQIKTALEREDEGTRPGAMRLLEDYLDDLKTNLDIGEYRIPVVIFSGDKAVLPEVFEKLNSTGVRLNKFDILASSWSDKRVAIRHLPQIAAAADKRRVQLDTAAVRREPRAASAAGSYELYDAVCGLGYAYLDGWPELFGLKEKPGGPKKSRDYVEPPSCAFNTVALSFGVRLVGIENVPKELERYGEAEEYFAAMLQAATDTAVTLRGFFAGNFEQAKIWHGHTELQMASIVASVFRATLGVAPDQYTSEEERAKRLRQHYLNDALRNEWAGTGDTKAVRAIVQDRYAKSVTRASFLSAAHSWYQDHLADARSRSKSTAKKWVDRPTLTFLRAYLSACGIDAGAELGPLQLEIVDEYAGAVLDTDAAIVSNVRILDARGQLVADPGSALPPLKSAPKRDQVTRHLAQRFEAMLDRIVLAYDFPKHA